MRQTAEKIVAWAKTAAEPCETNILFTRHWKQLNEVRQLLNKQIVALELEMAEFLVKTPYVLLLSVTGINVISDEVDRTDGPLVRQYNRQLRTAALQMADNLIKCNPYYRGLAALWTQQKVDPRDRHCRIANRAMRMVYHLVGGKQVWQRQGVKREYVLDKLRQFHQEHKSPIEQTIQALHETFKWLPKSTYTDEGKPLLEAAKPTRRLEVRTPATRP